MTKYRLLAAAAWGSLTGALLLASVPGSAQDPDRGRQWGRENRAEQRAERQAQPSSGGAEQRAPRVEQRAEPPTARTVQRSDGSGGGWSGRRDGGQSGVTRDRGAEMAARAAGARAQAGTDAGQATSTSGYAGARNRSYGATTRRDWAAERQAREAAGQQQRSSATWARSGDRSDDGRRGDWGDRSSSESRRADWQRDRRQDARRDDRRDDARNYASGYRDGRRDDNRWDNRYGQNYRRWDNRGWRNDNRYDWYRYRAANRSLYSLGRYYAPYRNYSYSRINIGFRLGSLFYGNRYWINDPWRYRLPDAYGPYRWIRYYDDALLVDVYSGQVVDVIHNFFW